MSSTPEPHFPPISPKEQRILEAVKWYNQSSNASIRSTAKRFGLSRTTLDRRLKNGLSRELANQRLQKLTARQEHALADWIAAQDRLGAAPTHAQVREFATRVLHESGSPDEIIGQRWTSRFLKRHSEISAKLAHPITAQRGHAVTIIHDSTNPTSDGPRTCRQLQIPSFPRPPPSQTQPTTSLFHRPRSAPSLPCPRRASSAPASMPPSPPV